MWLVFSTRCILRCYYTWSKHIIMQKVLITGGTGLLGRSLASALTSRGYDVIILSRSKGPVYTHPAIHYAQWDVAAGTIDDWAIAEADAIVHLAGAGVVAQKWTEAYKKEIVDSRTQSSALLCKALQKIPNDVHTIISASAIGWYGADKGGPAFTENDPADSGFLGHTCKLWEESMAPAAGLGKRLITYRIGIVLSHLGGALSEFKKPLRKGIAAVLGNGEQVVSWIHVTDLCRMIIAALEEDKYRGCYNAVAPNPVSNKKLTLTLAEKMRGKKFWTIKVPPFLLKLIMGESSIEVLKSTTVSSKKIEAVGFQFTHKTIESAVAES
jgi:uncharacterized protein